MIACSNGLSASRFGKTLMAALLALNIPLPARALDSAPPEALDVKIFPDRYVAAGKPFSDLAALEAWAKPIRIRFLWLDTCAPATARQLLAAVERFHSVYAEGIQIRALDPNDPRCVSEAEDANWSRITAVRLPSSDEYQATDESGRSSMP